MISLTSATIRRVDELGRIVLPIEVRRALGIEERDALSIKLEDNAIVLKKCQPSCVFCNSLANVITYKDKYVCKECATQVISKLDNSDKV